MESVGREDNLLARRRKYFGYTQEQVAEILGIHKNTYSLFEKDVDKFSVSQAAILQVLFKFDFNDIFVPLLSTKTVTKINEITFANNQKETLEE